MPRYITIAHPPRAAWGDDVPLLPQITVYDEPDAEDTGLVDSGGTKIYRVRERLKMGFE